MSHRATLLGRGYEDSHLDSPRLRFRRALVLSVMTIVVPGSAQLAVGRKAVGAFALTIWLAALGAGGYLLWRARTDRAGVIDVLTDPDNLLYLRVALIVVVALWVLLFVDAWRLAHPRRLNWVRGVALTVVNLAVIGTVAGSAAYASQVLGVSREVVKTVFAATETSEPLHGRYNILLIGSDSGPDRIGIRPDSLTVASIDTETGRTVLVSIPRNLQAVPFPEDSPMHQVYPYGFSCGSACLINAVHTYAANRTDLYPDADDPGLEATIDAVEGATGLKINYYFMVNLKGFRALIDSVGGVEIDVKTRIAMFGHEDSWKNVWIEPGLQKLNGRKALWYARSRVQSDDYTRMGRQKCLLAAMLDQLTPTTVVTNAVDIGKSSKELLSGNMPQTELGQFAELALKARGEKIVTVSLVPPQVNPVNPDYDAIHQLVQAGIDKSERADVATPTPTATPEEDKSQRSANNADDLDAVC
ncbi:MAG TPA: LCP family protein [Aeromicrobium sp.]|nr:LCP family protein [Aeromicrobium sp.]